MLVYVRHGATALNGEGSEERLRGRLEVPLADVGKQQAQDTAATLAKRLTALDSFETSPLHRTLQTAAIIGKRIGMKAVPNPDILDWDTGKLAGQKVEDVLPLVKHLITHPEEPAPGGQSFQDYLNYFVPAMQQKVNAPGVHLVIGHARGASVIQGLADNGGTSVDVQRVLDRPDVQPGGILIVNKRWGTTIHNPDVEKE